MSDFVTTTTMTTSSSQPDQLAVFCREVRNLLRSKPNCIIPFSKFVPAYHNHYGRQCCVYQFGYTKLIELLESIPHVVQIIGLDHTSSATTKDNQNHRYITLTHREQIKRFASDLIKVVKSQPGKQLKLSQFSQAYEQVLGRTFRVLDYGTNDINVLLAEIWEGTINIIPIKRENVNKELRDKPALFVDVSLGTVGSNPVLEQIVASHGLVNEPYITQQYPDCWFEIPKRERSEREIKRTKYFIWDVIELLSRMKPDYSVPFSKFIPAYHYYFNRQCKVSIFGFSKLIDLFESISPEVVEILDQGQGEEKRIQLAKRHWPPPTVTSISSSRQQLKQSAPASLIISGRCASASACASSSTSASSSSLVASVSPSSSASSSSSSSTSASSGAHEPIDNGPTEEEMMELEDELEAYEQLEAIKNKRSTRMAAILDIFKYSMY